MRLVGSCAEDEVGVFPILSHLQMKSTVPKACLEHPVTPARLCLPWLLPVKSSFCDPVLYIVFSHFQKVAQLKCCAYFIHSLHLNK